MKVDLPGMYCDKNGDDQFAVKLRDVDVIPESHYNLISVTKLTEEGHKVSGNKKDGLLSKKEDGSLSLTSESKLLREYCGVHKFDDLNLKEKLLQE
jgi:hypothetical protein